LLETIGKQLNRDFTPTSPTEPPIEPDLHGDPNSTPVAQLGGTEGAAHEMDGVSGAVDADSNLNSEDAIGGPVIDDTNGSHSSGATESGE
jgi:hypothetical protein